MAVVSRWRLIYMHKNTLSKHLWQKSADGLAILFSLTKSWRRFQKMVPDFGKYVVRKWRVIFCKNWKTYCHIIIILQIFEIFYFNIIRRSCMVFAKLAYLRIIHRSKIILAKEIHYNPNNHLKTTSVIMLNSILSRVITTIWRLHWKLVSRLSILYQMYLMFHRMKIRLTDTQEIIVPGFCAVRRPQINLSFYVTNLLNRSPSKISSNLKPLVASPHYNILYFSNQSFILAYNFSPQYCLSLFAVIFDQICLWGRSVLQIWENERFEKSSE